MKKQTAVQFLIEKIDFDANVRMFSRNEWKEIFDQAKQMEKEQMIDAILDNRNITSQVTLKDAESYYNETYGEKFGEKFGDQDEN